MPDDVDELILKMQHLAAQARAQREARSLEGRGKSLRSRAQQIAWAAQAELTAAEAQQHEGEEKLLRARDPALSPVAAAGLLEEGRRLTAEARTSIVKARAKLNYALDQLDEGERREYEALRAEARAEAHAQMAEDPLFKGAPPVSAPAGTATPPLAAPASAKSATSGGDSPAARGDPAPAPRKTLGPRRRKGK